MLDIKEITSYCSSDGMIFESWEEAFYHEIISIESTTQAKFTVYYYDGHERKVFTSLRDVEEYNILKYGYIVNIENEAALKLLTDYFEEYGYTPPSHLGWNIFNEEWQTFEEFKASIEENYPEFYPIKISVSIGE